MKKALPILVIAILLGAITGGIFFLKNTLMSSDNGGSSLESSSPKEEVLKQLSVEESPFASLTPRADGHEFHLLVTSIPSGVENLEYELVYKVASGITQGVPGTVKVSGQTKIERDLLLGTCSSGKCRYDEGVENGTFTIRLRNSRGQLIAKMETPFHLQKDGKEIKSSDGSFSISQAKTSANTFYVTMGTFGLPAKAPGTVISGPVGVFTKGSANVSGTVNLSGDGKLYFWNGSKWVGSDGKTSSLGVFVRITSQ